MVRADVILTGRKLVPILWFALCGLVGCAVWPGPQPATVYPASTPQPPAFTSASVVTPLQPSSIPARPAVSLVADLDYAARTVQAREIIAYPNRTGVPLPSLAFDVLAARRLGVFQLAASQVQGDPSAAFRLDGAVLHVDLTRPLPSDGVVVVTIQYTLDLPAIPPGADANLGALGWSAHQTNLGDWFPAVSAYRQGWIAERNPPHLIGETTAPEATDISVDLGVSHAPERLLVLAGAPAQHTAGRYRFELPAARSFALSLGTGFQISEATTSSGVLVRSAFFPEHASAGRAALQTTVAALDAYAARFGPYRYSVLSVVEADFADGMEYSGLYFLGSDYYAAYDGTPRNYLTAIAAHETAHQWWYGDVGNDQGREPWLDEALCTYSEHVFYEASYPDLPTWWWNFRVTRFNPAGWVNSSVYDFQAFRPYVNAVYLRGALFLRDLRASMGDDAFFDFLRRYHSAHSGRVAAGDDFWSLLDGYRIPNLDRLRAQYWSR